MKSRPSPRVLSACFSLLAFGACAVEDVDFGERSVPVIGGEETEAGQYPATGALVLQGEFMCTATLIRPDVLLTAAHCIDPLLTGGMTPGFTLKHDANSLSAGDVIAGIESTAHPSFSLFNAPGDGVGQFFDIGIIKLAEAVEGVTPARLPTVAEVEEHLLVDAPLEIVGYGFRDVEATLAGVKYHGLATLREVGTHELFLGDGTEAQNCNGDSGGPAFLAIPDDGVRLVGVVSRAPDMNPTCDHGGIDTRVDPYLDWIAEVLGESVDEPDAGMQVMGSDAGIGEEDEEEGGCGCRASSGSQRGGMLVLILLVGAALARRCGGPSQRRKR